MTWWQQAGSSHPKSWVVALGVIAALAGVAQFMSWRGTAAEVVTVASGPIQQSLVFSARVSSVARNELSSTLTARVNQVLVREGDSVKAGQLLVALDDTDLRAQAEQAQAAITTAGTRLKSQTELSGPVAAQALAQSRAALDFAQAELERTRSLHAQGFIGDAKLQDVERAATSARAAFQQASTQASANTRDGTEVQSARARIKEAQAALDVVKARLTQTRVTAPADGRVIGRSVEVGDVAQPGRKLLTLSVAGETRLIAQIDEKNLRLVHEGMRAVASADAFPDKRFDAELTYLAPAVDVARGTVEARLRVNQPPAFLRDDMTVSAEVVVANKPDALTLPTGALREAGERQYVLVLRDRVAQEQDVKPGVRSLQRVEILSGLRAGDEVVLDARVRSGQRIRAIAPVAATRAKGVDMPMPGGQ